MIEKFRTQIAGHMLVAVLLCSCAVAQEGVPEKRVTVYTTYGYQGTDGWNISFETLGP